MPALGLVPAALISSPYLRCVQTLEPLSREHAVPVTTDNRLAEGVDIEPVLDLLNEAPDTAVLCSHGDVIPMLIDALLRRGMILDSMVPGVKKGSWFSLERDGSEWVRASWNPAPR